MKYLADTLGRSGASNERGGARFNFLIVIALIGSVVYAGSRYVPVAYQAYLFKDLMYEKVTFAAATGKPAEWIARELKNDMGEYGVPPDAAIKVQQRDGRLEAHAQWTRPVELPGFVYQYNFDHTTRSDSWLTTK